MATVAAALAGCGDSDTNPAATDAKASPTPPAASATVTPTARRWTSGYPNSIAVLGHSGATGESSDPDYPHVEVRENSWATGTNPAVNSLYRRILSHNPAIKGNNVNLAQGGATVDDLASEAEELLAIEPKPELIVIQIMDNDIVCPASGALSEFRSKLAATLRRLAAGAPDSSLFVVSPFGSPTTGWKTLSQDERISSGGTGPCDFLNPDGKLVPNKLDRLEKAIHGYEAQLEGACRQVRQCTYDDGAFGRIVDKREYTATDLNHFSIKGHAKAAAVAWSAMRRAGVVPR